MPLDLNTLKEFSGYTGDTVNNRSLIASKRISSSGNESELEVGGEVLVGWMGHMVEFIAGKQQLPADQKNRNELFKQAIEATLREAFTPIDATEAINSVLGNDYDGRDITKEDVRQIIFKAEHQATGRVDLNLQYAETYFDNFLNEEAQDLPRFKELFLEAIKKHPRSSKDLLRSRDVAIDDGKAEKISTPLSGFVLQQGHFISTPHKGEGGNTQNQVALMEKLDRPSLMSQAVEEKTTFKEIADEVRKDTIEQRNSELRKNFPALFIDQPEIARALQGVQRAGDLLAQMTFEIKEAACLKENLDIKNFDKPNNVNDLRDQVKVHQAYLKKLQESLNELAETEDVVLVEIASTLRDRISELQKEDSDEDEFLLVDKNNISKEENPTEQKQIVLKDQIFALQKEIDLQSNRLALKEAALTQYLKSNPFNDKNVLYPRRIHAEAVRLTSERIVAELKIRRETAQKPITEEKQELRTLRGKNEATDISLSSLPWRLLESNAILQKESRLNEVTKENGKLLQAEEKLKISTEQWYKQEVAAYEQVNPETSSQRPVFYTTATGPSNPIVFYSAQHAAEELQCLCRDAGVPLDITSRLSGEVIKKADRQAMDEVLEWKTIERDMTVIRNGETKRYRHISTPLSNSTTAVGHQMNAQGIKGIIPEVRNDGRAPINTRVTQLFEVLDEKNEDGTYNIRLVHERLQHGINDHFRLKKNEEDDAENQKIIEEVMSLGVTVYHDDMIKIEDDNKESDREKIIFKEDDFEIIKPEDVEEILLVDDEGDFLVHEETKSDEVLSRGKANRKSAEQSIQCGIEADPAFVTAQLAKEEGEVAGKVFFINTNLTTPTKTPRGVSHDERSFSTKQGEAFLAASGRGKIFTVLDLVSKQDKEIAVDVTFIDFRFPVNYALDLVGALDLGMVSGAWRELHHHNAAELKKLFGSLDLSGPVEGLMAPTCKKLRSLAADQNKSEEKRAGATKMLRDIKAQCDHVRSVFADKSYQSAKDGDRFKMPRHLDLLVNKFREASRLVNDLDTRVINAGGCMSGKDREGVANVEAEAAVIIEEMGGSVTPGYNFTEEERAIYNTAMTIVVDNTRQVTGYGGSKNAHEVRNRIADLNVIRYAHGLSEKAKT
ncbi:MAG: hypothetical protein ACH346_03625 [Chthoniobacterales bacterium]